jgi:Flp pilus assembly protein TadG
MSAKTYLRRRIRRHGAATVEMAVIAPLLVGLTLGVVDVGQHVHVAQIVSNASREGARLAVKHSTADVTEVETAVLGYLAASFPSIPQSTFDSEVTVAATDSNGNSIASTNLGGLAAGELVNVSVSLPFDTVRWLDVLPTLSGTTMSATTTMRRE